ncbi:MAG: glycosyltransferase [Cyclobacteriaceae bacterium]|nr:glycosyltransferase [Cyclobacteriaceae bacterium HetDA_MAG_MS6]
MSEVTARKKLLLISPYFPPMTDIGGKRAINLVQELPKLGWEVIVLASSAFGKKEDLSLLDAVPANTIVHRGFRSRLRNVLVFIDRLLKSEKKPKKKSTTESAKTDSTKSKKKYNSLTPYDQFLWDVPAAVSAGKKLIKQYRPDVILVNADPWSGLLAGHRLSKWSGIPWVADFRDPWSIFDEKMSGRPIWTQRQIRKNEYRFFSSASAIILNTKNASDRYQKTYEGRVIPEKFSAIRNAYNLNLLTGTEIAEDTNRNNQFKLCYFGSFRRFVSPDIMLKGFRQFLDQESTSYKDISLTIYDKKTNSIEAQIEELDLGAYIHFHDPVSPTATLSVLRSYSLLLLVVSPYYKLMIPAKLYDYLAAQKPILTLSDNAEVNQIISKTKAGKFVPYEDISGFAKALHFFFSKRQEGLLKNSEISHQFGSEHQALLFDQILRKLT